MGRGEPPQGSRTRDEQSVGYVSRTDTTDACVLWDFRATSILSRDWERHLEDMRAVALSSERTTVRPAVMLFVPERWAMPDADQRTKLAQASGHPGYNPFLAIVTRNPLARGVLRVLTWLNENPRYDAQVFAEASDALAWLEGKRGQPLPTLRRWIEQR